MTADRSPAELADDAAEAIRALNHATYPGQSGYEWPSDVDAVIGSLELLANRMCQALNQATRWITTEHAAGRVGLDTPGDVSTRIGHLNEHLDLALCDATLLAHSLNLARAESTHLTGLAP